MTTDPEIRPRRGRKVGARGFVPGSRRGVRGETCGETRVDVTRGRPTTDPDRGNATGGPAARDPVEGPDPRPLTVGGGVWEGRRRHPFSPLYPRPSFHYLRGPDPHPGWVRHTTTPATSADGALRPVYPAPRVPRVAAVTVRVSTRTAVTTEEGRRRPHYHSGTKPTGRRR